jgi:hypothetical protein
MEYEWVELLNISMESYVIKYIIIILAPDLRATSRRLPFKRRMIAGTLHDSGHKQTP